nr:hypothetical protein [Tanacetum cinerariifolium]
MANLSDDIQCAGFDHDHYQEAACAHHEDHMMHDNVQLDHVVDSHADYTSDSNIILYDQYVKDNEALTKEVKEMKDVFEELEAEVAQYAVDRKHDAIELKNLLIANDNLIAECLSQEVFCVATNSELNVARFTEMHVANTTAEAHCLALEAELVNLRDTNNHDNQKELINHFSKLKTTDSQITKLTDQVTHLQAQNDLFRAENDKIKQHYKELYDSIKITRAKHIEQVTKLTTENVNMKTSVSKATFNPQVSAQDKHAIDVEPIVPRLRNNRDARLDCLRHLKESVEIIRNIVEEAKVVRPRDRSIVFACRYTKHSHELLEYAIGTCPQGSQQLAKQFAYIPLIRKKQVTVSKPSDKSDSTTHPHVMTVKSQKTNVPVPPSTGVNSCSNASGSQPKSHVKSNRISPAKGVNKLPVEDQPRINKSYLITSNRADSSSRLKRTEHVELYEQWAKFELTEREQKINEQLRTVISDRNFKEETLKRELHSIKLQLASTINHNKSMVEEVSFLKKDFKQKEDKYLIDFLDMKTLKEKVEDKLIKQDESLQTVHMLCRLRPNSNELNRVAIGYKNPLCLTHAKQVQPALYNGHEILKDNHKLTIVHDTEDTLEIAKITRKKMNDKMNDLKQLTPEQIFWSNDLMKLKSEALKEQTKGIQKALTKEVKEMKAVFEELEAEVAQYAVDRKRDAIELKNILIANDNLIAECLSQEVFCMATNSELNVAQFTEMYVANTTAEARCLALEAELANLHDTNNHDNQKELINHFYKLKLANIPLIRKKQVPVAKPSDKSDSTTHPHVVTVKSQKTNVPVPPSTRVNRCLNASGSQPKIHVKSYRISPANGVSKLPVEDQPRTNKSYLRTSNRVHSSSRLKRTHYKELYNSIKITRAKHIEQVTKLTTKNMNLKTSISKATVNHQVSARDKHAIDVEPIVLRLRNNRDARLDYLRHLKESVGTIRDIVKEAKVVRPRDRFVVSACRYTKHSQELLEYAIGTCPQGSQQQAKQLAYIPLIRKKQVTVAKPSDKSDIAPNASGSQPKSHVKSNRISPAKGVNKLSVEDQPRTNKPQLRTSNRVDSSSHLKRTVNNLNSDSICQTCNKYLTSSNHDMCVATFLQSVVATPFIRHNCSVERKVKQVWKPKQVRQVWKPTGKVLTTIGHQWRPTGQIFNLGNQCLLPRFTPPKVVFSKPDKKRASTCANPKEPNQNWGSNFSNSPSLSGKLVAKKTAIPNNGALFPDTEEKSSVPPHNFPSMILQKIMWNSHKMADLNAPPGQTPEMAPPLRADDQILPHIRWVPIGKSNCYLDLEKSQSNPIYKITVDLLKNTNFFRAFTASSTIPSIYIQWFWDTILYDKKAECYSQAFVAPPSIDGLIDFVNQLGYPKLVRNLSNGVFTRTNIDYAERIWEEFTQSIHAFIKDKRNLSRHTSGKKRATLIVIPSIRFTKLIIYHLQRRHRFHPRPDSSLHLPNEEPVLGYLKFSAKGTKREVFGMPIPGPPASKPTQPARKPKTIAPKAPSRPSVSIPVRSAQPAPTSAPAKPQEKKHKQAIETSDKPPKEKKSKHGWVGKKRSRKNVEASKTEEVPTVEPQVADEDAEYQKVLEESMKDAYALPRGTLPPVVIREPESGKYQPLLEAGPDSGDAEAKVQSILSHVVYVGSDHEHMDLDVADVSPQPSTEQLDEGDKPSDADKNAETEVESMVNVTIQQALSLISLMTSPIIDLTSRPESPKEHQQLKATTTNTTTTTFPPLQAPQQSMTEAMMVKRIGELEHIMADLIQVNKDMEERLDSHGSRLHTLEQLDIPNRLALLACGNPIPTSLMMTTCSYLKLLKSKAGGNLLKKNDLSSALASNYLPPPKDSLLAQTGDVATFIDWFCKRRGITELKPQDLEGPTFEIIKVFHPDVIHLQYQMEECHKLLTDSVDDPILRNNVNKPLPLGGPPGQVTIQSNFFFNKDLDYLRYGSKGSRHALSILKMKATYYPDAGLEQMVPDQFWINEECKYDVAAMYGISHWWFQRQRFYIDRHTSEGDRSAVRTHMWILSVVRIEVFSMYGYDYMKKIVLRRADLNEHVIAERDFKYLYPSDFEDLYLLNLQEDFQLGIESYQTQVNLTKPQWTTTGFEYKHDYKVIESPRAVIFRDKYGVQMMMRFNELHKFSDGTLQQIDEALDYRVKEFRINRMNPGLNTRF